MCTLAVALQGDSRWPLVVAANRDERLDRPSEGWALRETAGGVRLAAPRDLVAGGTWIGVSASAMFAAVTNHHVVEPGFPDPRRRTRGQLVGRALEHATVEAARAELSRVDAAAYNPFHLLVADAHRAFLWWYDGRDSAVDDLAPGLHVVTESRHDGLEPRGELVRARWPLEPDPARLRGLLAIHLPGRTGTCIHAGPTYGTRSSTVLRLSAGLASSDLFVADGSPCTSPLEDRSRLLVALSASP